MPHHAPAPDDRHGELRSKQPSVGILWGEASTSRLYQPWLSRIPADIRVFVIPDYDSQHPLSQDVDLLVAHNHYRWDELAVLRQALVQKNCGVLVLADGLAEYRNTWQNPAIPIGSLMQPVQAHKIATISQAQSRLFEAWGNIGKCETVGLPYLDDRALHYGWLDQTSERPVEPYLPPHTVSPTLLVCSARTPAFSDSQWVTVIEQFRQLHAFLQEGLSLVDGQRVRVTWRVAERIRSELGLSDEQISSGSLQQEIDASWAVITTPSTVQLEAMLARRPVALLDFFNVPHFAAAAWTISCPQHFSSVIPELLAPPAERLWHQEILFREQLACETPATQRMCDLISSMARIACRQRQLGRQVCFPEQILQRRMSDRFLSEIDWERLHPRRQQLRALADSRQATLGEATELDAALIRAREYSEERRQLHYLTVAHRDSVAYYEKSAAEKIEFIESQKKSLEEFVQRLHELNEKLERRNQECEQMQVRIKQLAAEKQDAHERLQAAYADAKRKQERVNELRQQNEQLRAQYAEHSNLIKELRQKMQVIHDDSNQIRAAHRQLREQLDQVQHPNRPG